MPFADSALVQVKIQAVKDISTIVDMLLPWQPEHESDVKFYPNKPLISELATDVLSKVTIFAEVLPEIILVPLMKLGKAKTDDLLELSCELGKALQDKPDNDSWKTQEKAKV